ncbi:MAG: 50S ribosomal protein L21 [Patescibacteria group bacterium]|jgi:large subunit ribosomal protein L21
MKYAVVKIQGAQYKVSEGDEIEVNKLSEDEGKEVKFDEVLLAGEDSKVKVGTPTLKDAFVSAKIVKQFLGEKLHVFKYKAKVGYRRKIGFRPQKTLLKIEKITL